VFIKISGNVEVIFKTDKSNYPYDLLLLADETRDAIDKYLFDSTVYLIKYNSIEIGVFCLYEINQDIIELKNIAISQSCRNKGLGSFAIQYIKNLCKAHYKELIVGTGDSGIQQINFYEKNGFEKYSIHKNFFIENYADPIFENRKQLIDMVMLRCRL